MNWIEEVRAVLRGMQVDSVEMSEAVVVKFGSVWLWLTSDRAMALELRGSGLLTRETRSQIEVVEDNLAARGWVAS